MAFVPLDYYEITLLFWIRNDLTEEEYDSMKEETLEQIKEFTATLDRLNKGDVTLNSKISSMRQVCIHCYSKCEISLIRVH